MAVWSARWRAAGRASRQSPHHGAQIERGARRARAMVFLADGDAEEQHDALLAELVDGSAVALGNGPRVALQPPNDFVDFLWSATLDEFREA